MIIDLTPKALLPPPPEKSENSEKSALVGGEREYILPRRHAPASSKKKSQSIITFFSENCRAKFSITRCRADAVECSSISYEPDNHHALTCSCRSCVGLYWVKNSSHVVRTIRGRFPRNAQGKCKCEYGTMAMRPEGWKVESAGSSW